MALHESHWGDVAHDDVTLQVVDVLMRPIDKIMLGRKVHLRASITGTYAQYRSMCKTTVVVEMTQHIGT